MNYVSAQDIKRCGISAVDKALEDGPVHVIKNNRPQYVVLTQEDYRDLLDAREEVAVARVKASLEDAEAGRLTRHDSVDALMQSLEAGTEP